jgi:hypothetical protein
MTHLTVVYFGLKLGIGMSSLASFGNLAASPQISPSSNFYPTFDSSSTFKIAIR